MKTRLNQKLADKLPQIPEGKKSMEYRDIELPGFLISQYHSNPNVGSFTLRYRDENGRQRALKIGRTNEMSLKQAKAIAKIKKSEIALGGDPSGDNEKKRSELTYGEAVEQYYLPDVEQRLRRPKFYRQLFDYRIKPELGHKKINSITRADVQAFHSQLRNEMSAAYANRHLQIIKASYNFFINTLEVAKIRNPAVGLKLFYEPPKDRVLSTQELEGLLPVLMNAEPEYQLQARVIRFLLATALRPSECFQIHWDDVDIENQRLLLRNTVSKNRQTQATRLNSVAIQVLSECSKEFDFPFANPKTGKPLTSIKKAFSTLMSRAKIEGMTPHRCRATALTLAIQNGASLFDTQMLARHASPVTTTTHYLKASTQSLERVSDSISDQLLKAETGKDGSNVIPIDKASGEN